MIRNNYGFGTDIDGATGIVGGENSFGNDWAVPDFTQPFEVFPSDDGGS